MSWLECVAEGAPPFQQVLGLRSEHFEQYRELYGLLWDDELVDPRLLELCRLRVAQLHRSASELSVRYDVALDQGLTEEKIAALPSCPTSPLYDERERACLAYAEKLVIDVHAITDEEASAVAAGLGPDGLVALTLALGLFDGLGRFRTVLGLQPPFDTATVVPAPTSAAGPLY